MRDFKLSPTFLADYEGTQPGFGPLGYVTYKRTYSRKLEDGSTEEFWQTCQRVVEGVYSAQKRHVKNLGLPWNNEKAQRSAQEMFRRMWEFKWLPPGRGLWMMGTPYIERAGGAALNNCGFVSTRGIKDDLADPFCWMMDMLMLGVGVGFDTKGEGIVTVQAPRQGTHTFQVADSREGWVDLLRATILPYSGKGYVPAEIDYSLVRPEGSAIAGFGGTASGPKPLQELVSSVKEILDALVGQEITTEAIVDVANLIGRCVVAGNVRRSAEIAFGDPHNETFLDLKDWDKNREAVEHHRWASNNSVFADVGMDYSLVAQRTATNGEPGYEWLENAQDYSRMGRDPDYKDRRVAGANPCVEQSLEDRELCCLVETFPSRHDTYDDYRKTLKYAYLYAKSVTLIHTHDQRTNAVMMRNRRIGCSMSGIVQAMARHGRREFFSWCDQGYNYLEDLDVVYSEWLCIPLSVKKTSVKPSGTVSLLPGVTPGIHYPHSEYYIRRIRFQETHPLVDALRTKGYHIEKDVYSPNTVVAEFPVHEEYFDRSKSDVTMWEQLENAAQMQTYWADNQVSVTVTFDKDREGHDIKYALELYETRLKGVSFLPVSDHGFAQAPYEEIDEKKYKDMIANVNENVQLADLISGNGEVQDSLDRFCDGEVCKI
jgi:ribonucleoside-triphosphate reductase